MKEPIRILLVTAAVFAVATVFAQTPHRVFPARAIGPEPPAIYGASPDLEAQPSVDLNIGPSGQFCGAQTATEVKCTVNAYFEDAQGSNIGSTLVAFDLKANGLSTVTIAGTSYQVTSPFPGVVYPAYPQHPKAQGVLTINFTDGTKTRTLAAPYLSDYQCNSGRVCAGKAVITVLPSSTLDGEASGQ